MTDAADQLVVAPAWWDPKNRKAIWNPETVIAGVLTATADSCMFAHPPSTIVFNESIKGATLGWSKARVAVTLELPNSRLSYRIFLAPPVKGVPTLSETEKGELAEVFGQAAKVGEAFEWGGALLKNAGQLADVFSLATRSAVYLSGYKNLGRLKQLWAASAA